jgi:hypothetical protein
MRGQAWKAVGSLIGGRSPKSVEQHKRGGATRHNIVTFLVGGRYKPVCHKHLTGEGTRAYRMLVHGQWAGGS